ncbi:MAG TPA: UDP-3-O-(3-hydroxymyristoyl)glucosamine N-acyltransferase [Rhizomicrobium sp.]|jgi:UDP-3-O-[3-hydroxymyristoyl] glucosamine N-acyltransferase|nr:UDP-3-O-(3-hydroxymyristoyl)glucosamine N-acyltransferase [Rhizomicrobium sp.]
MADPRFFTNHGPFTLARICEVACLAPPAGAEGTLEIFDLADLAGADRGHLTFFSGALPLREAFAASRAGVCLAPAHRMTDPRMPGPPPGMVVLAAPSVPHAFAAIAELFYPDSSQPTWPEAPAVSPRAKLEPGVRIGPGVTIGENAEIGEGTRLGPNSVIGPGVAIGKGCEIGSHVTVTHAYVGDRVTILPGAHIGQPGFGFASSAAGHLKIPQLGRVIIQDGVEIGSGTTIDRGSLGDTVIGEGTKLDNLIMVGHNVQIGRHCVIAGQCGIAGSCVIEDFVVMGGQVGFGDHTHIGAGARFAARSGTGSAVVLEGGRDYGGAPAKPVREWAREIHAVTNLAKRRKQDDT